MTDRPDIENTLGGDSAVRSTDAGTGTDTGTASGERDLHNMGGDIGPASIRGSNAPVDASTPPGYATRAPIGAADTPNVAGTDEQQPHIAGSLDQSPGPAATADEPPRRGPDVEIDDVDVAGRGADGDTNARIEQKKRGGP